ncbi:MAG: DUF3810 domain-containing protein [Clostridia bacterium]|nr:DUF3810 domain-containing protein [Clostridia bacterium]
MTLKKNSKKITANFILLLVVIVFALLLIIFQVLKLNPTIAENFFSRGASRAYLNVAIKVGNAIPFSLYDTFVILGIIFFVTILFFVIFFLCKKNFKLFARTVLILLLVVLFFFNIYSLVASGNYNRDTLPVTKYEGEELTKEEFNNVVIKLLQDYSRCADTLQYTEEGKSVQPYTFDEINELLAIEYTKYTDSYYNSETAYCKNSIFSPILSYENITGIALVFVGQATINSETPDVYKVVTMAHEMAHMKGCLREKDANIQAHHLLLNSDNNYLRYCGYMYTLKYVLSVLRVYDQDMYNETVSTYFPKKANKDGSLEDAFWDTKQGIINKISDFFNDLYLKMSGVKEGTANYSDPSQYTKDNEEIHVSYSTTVRILIDVANNLNIE